MVLNNHKRDYREMKIAETIYLFAAKCGWVWLVKFLFYTGLIEDEQITSTVDEKGHSALYHALSDEALATILHEKVNNICAWPEFNVDLEREEKEQKLRDICEKAFSAQAGFLFDWIEAKQDVALLQTMLKLFVSTKEVADVTYSVHATRKTWLDVAIAQSSVRQENKLIKSISSLIKASISLIKASIPTVETQNCTAITIDGSGSEQITMGKVFARALFSAVLYGKTEIVALFLDNRYLTAKDISEYNDTAVGSEHTTTAARQRYCLNGRAAASEGVLISGCTALDWAVKNGNEEVVTMLLDFEVVQTESSTLMNALIECDNPKVNTKILQILLENYFRGNPQRKNTYPKASYPYERYEQLQKELKSTHQNALRDKNLQLADLVGPYVRPESDFTQSGAMHVSTAVVAFLGFPPARTAAAVVEELMSGGI
jgi:hypothetical protein